MHRIVLELYVILEGDLRVHVWYYDLDTPSIDYTEDVLGLLSTLSP